MLSVGEIGQVNFAIVHCASVFVVYDFAFWRVHNLPV